MLEGGSEMEQHGIVVRQAPTLVNRFRLLLRGFHFGSSVF